MARATERPDLLDALYEPFNLDWRGEEAEGAQPWYQLPMFSDAREAFEDDPDPERRRHLLRMWISYSPEKRQALSPLLAERYRYVEAGGMPIKTKG